MRSESIGLANVPMCLQRRWKLLKWKWNSDQDKNVCSGFVIICKILYINLDSKVWKISLGALIGYVHVSDEGREIGNAVFLSPQKQPFSPFISSFPTLYRLMAAYQPNVLHI